MAKSVVPLWSICGPSITRCADHHFKRKCAAQFTALDVFLSLKSADSFILPGDSDAVKVT